MTEMFREYVIDKIDIESVNIKSFYLKPKDGEILPVFLAGQFVNLKIPGFDKKVTRSYTLSDSPGKAHFRITVKREMEGKVSGYLHDVVSMGDTVLLSKPIGNFHASNQPADPVVLLSGGVGITPMLSITEYSINHEPGRHVYFIHSSINKEVQPMRQRLRQIKAGKNNFQLSVFHSEPLTDELAGIDYDYRGFITKEHIPVDKTAAYFVCGPAGFIETMVGYLKELAIEENKIHVEFFGTQKETRAKEIYLDPESTSFAVNLTKSNKLISWKEGMGNLLELIESAGITPANNCRMGTCSSCETKLTKGTYEYNPEPFVETADGNVLICCARPTSNIELEL